MAAVAEPMAADPAKHRHELIERLDSLRENGSFCDVTVAIKGKEFKAHRVVLAAASPFFLSLLESDMRESNERLIRIELEEATASVMEDVLKYVYTGNVSVTEESGHNLIATADYLLLLGLKTAACDFWKENVTIENCVFNYYFADKYQCMELKEKCGEVINSNFSVIMETEDFLNLDVKQVMEWVSSDDITVSAEEEVFKGIVKWVTYNKRERESYFSDLLRQVCLMSISQDFLFDKLVKEELITTNIECVNFVLASMKGVFNPTDTECNTRPPRKCLEMYVDVIFVCGGRKALCYLPHENTWYKLRNTMFAHQEHAVVQCKDKVLIFDDLEVGPGQSQAIEYYMPSTDCWGTMQTGLPCNSFSTLSVLNGDVYATDVDTEGAIYQYCPVKNNWKQVKEPLTVRFGTCSVSDGTHLYIIGGTSTDDETSDRGSPTVERYDPSTDSWEEVAAMNEERHDAFGAAMNGKIYVAGGFCKFGSIGLCVVLDTCEVYNASTNEWEVMSELNVPRHSANMVCFKGVLYVIGGIQDRKTFKRELSVEVFDPEENVWETQSTIPVSHENREERKKEMHYKACCATIHKSMLNKYKKL